MKRIIIFLTTAMLILSACPDKRSNQRKALGPSELLAEINVAFENKKFVTVTVLYRFLKSRHRNTPEYKEAESICSKAALLAEMYIAFENKEFATVKILYEFLKSNHRNTLEFKEAERIYSKAEYIQRTEKVEEAAHKAEVDRKTKLTALKRLRLKKTVDDIYGITWYTQPYFEHFNWDNGISMYLGDNGTQHWLRLKMSYGGDDWIFFENAYLSYDGNTKEVLFDEYDDKKTEVGNYADFGWADCVMVLLTPNV